MFEPFECELNSDIATFFNHKAVEYEKSFRSRTFIIYNLHTNKNNKNDILAYYTLSLKSVKIPSDSIPKRIAGKLGGKKRLENEIPAFLIGQLGKNSNAKDNIPGKDLLEEAMSMIFVAQECVGCRLVILECEEKPKLINFYKANGFLYLQNQKERSNDLAQMIKVVETQSV
ncbi:MAG: hypothetical protein WCJ01_10135 [Ignavibacteria bacterium]